MFLLRRFQLSLAFSTVVKKVSSELDFVPQCLPVEEAKSAKFLFFVYFLVLVLHPGYLRYFAALNQFFQYTIFLKFLFAPVLCGGRKLQTGELIRKNETELNYLTPREAWNWQTFALEKWRICPRLCSTLWMFTCNLSSSTKSLWRETREI